MADVVLSGVGKTFDGDVPAVCDVDLQIADREFVVLVGPSGCGKSTTLRMIAGLEQPSCGEIRIGDRLVNRVPPAERDIAMVFQDYALYPHMTVYQNMAFSLRLRHLPKSEIERRVRKAARMLALEELLTRKPKALSGGQRQRVAMGRAIVREPAVFLFDEPLSNLDAKMRVQMRAELSQLHEQLAATMIHVTHDQVEAMTLGDRIVVMDRGRIQQCDAPLTVYEQPANSFVASFIGTPPMNLLPGHLNHEDGKLRFRSAAGELDLPASLGARLADRNQRSLLLGIRPEDLHLGDATGGIPARMLMQETLGNELLLHCEHAGTPIVCRCPPHEKPATDGPVHLHADLSKAHLFSAASGRNLTMSEKRNEGLTRKRT